MFTSVGIFSANRGESTKQNVAYRPLTQLRNFHIKGNSRILVNFQVNFRESQN